MLVKALLGIKGNRGFMDFEHWQAMMHVTKYLFGTDPKYPDIFEDKAIDDNEEFQWDIQKSHEKV